LSTIGATFSGLYIKLITNHGTLGKPGFRPN
jgi:hypothetical protein